MDLLDNIRRDGVRELRYYTVNVKASPSSSEV